MLITSARVDAQRSAFALDRKSSADLIRLAEHCEQVAPLAALAINARDSVALATACRAVVAERSAAPA